MAALRYDFISFGSIFVLCTLELNGKKKVYKWKPMLRRPLGRPRNRWEDDIINDMEKMINKELD
jgi:hypothetical protein